MCRVVCEIRQHWRRHAVVPPSLRFFRLKIQLHVSQQRQISCYSFKVWNCIMHGILGLQWVAVVYSCDTCVQVNVVPFSVWALGMKMIPVYWQSCSRWFNHMLRRFAAVTFCQPTVTFPAAELHHFHCLATEARVCEELVQSCHIKEPLYHLLRFILLAREVLRFILSTVNKQHIVISLMSFFRHSSVWKLERKLTFVNTSVHLISIPVRC